jgi:hypothetical protein
MVGHLVNKELEKIWTEAVMVILRYYAIIHLERLRKAMETPRIPGVLTNI